MLCASGSTRTLIRLRTVSLQVVDGLLFAFPNYLNNLEAEGQYKHVFGLHESVGKSKNVSQYLSSDHRRKYSMGLYRHYPELDA
jgi:glutathione S-transferase